MGLQPGWLKRQFGLNNKTIAGWSQVKKAVMFRGCDMGNIYSSDMTSKDWLIKAGLTWQKHERADGSLLGMSVHDSDGDRLHEEPYCTAEGAIELAKQVLST